MLSVGIALARVVNLPYTKLNHLATFIIKDRAVKSDKTAPTRAKLIPYFRTETLKKGSTYLSKPIYGSTPRGGGGGGCLTGV